MRYTNATFTHHRYGAELTAATTHRLHLAAAQGAVGITSDPTLTLVELLALAPHERKTHWAALDRATKVAIVREHLTAKGKPSERADVDALVAALNARVGVVTSDDLTDPLPIDDATYQQLCWLLVQRYGVVAVERMQRNLSNPATQVLFVDGRLYVTSASERTRIHTTDGAACPCKGGGHATCWHRTLWHLYTLWTALVDPTELFRTAAYVQESHDVKRPPSPSPNRRNPVCHRGLGRCRMVALDGGLRVVLACIGQPVPVYRFTASPFTGDAPP